MTEVVVRVQEIVASMGGGRWVDESNFMRNMVCTSRIQNSYANYFKDANIEVSKEHNIFFLRTLFNNMQKIKFAKNSISRY